MVGDGLYGEEGLDERDVGGDVAGIWTVPSGFERRSAVKDRQNASTTCVPMAREFPVLILAFRDNHAVVHLMSDTERMSCTAANHGVRGRPGSSMAPAALAPSRYGSGGVSRFGGGWNWLRGTEDRSGIEKHTRAGSF
ncbi:hypothetical protein ACSHXN_45960 (plasmid) [Streptomyces sp. HUAS TT11]|uniref:hypothetical protein n=1 Tax=Streptomyces sp. HUAS TT11 TaxID=3447508 RepID=UPI003F65AB24